MPDARKRTGAALALALSLSLNAVQAARAADPPSKQEYGPDPASVQRFGKGYRYPQAGWIVLHIEGTPYERGYQHGRLMAPEIGDYLKMLADKRSKSDPAAAWRQVRTLTDALFLRRFDREFLEEMKGIADGASAAGARFDGRPLDLTDVAALNADIEMEFLDGALEALANGLEGKVFPEPADAKPRAPHEEHCSAFAATGPATADGKIVFGHITMFNVAFVRHFNVWLDVKPSDGHRVLMQTYPGGIQSGMDYYMNDAGLLVTETTIAQTKFSPDGDALASRTRKALQYADSIDKAVALLTKANNGLYTNEWLLGDIKTDEVAMYELGTHKSRLWRSGKDDWFGGTKGFYWGCNNAKDLDVRLETLPGAVGKPANVVWSPTDRDIAWVKLFEKAKGKIDAAFGFEAFTTPPLAAFSSLDAKFTTSAMARELKTHALFGNPLGRTWDPTEADLRRLPTIRPLVSNDWTVLSADAPASPDKKPTPSVDLAGRTSFPTAHAGDGERPAAWHGTILPDEPEDTWLAAAFADYERIVALELAFKADDGKLSPAEQEELALASRHHEAGRWLATLQLGKDVALDRTETSLTQRAWYAIAASKGVDVLASIRKSLGDEAFLTFMDHFGRAHAGQPATTAEFLGAADRAKAGSTAEARRLIALVAKPTTPAWSVESFNDELDRTIIVYGTRKDVSAQREAADRLQRQIARRWPNIYVPIRSDAEATESDLKSNHVLLIGRPDTNAAMPGLVGNLPVKFGPTSFAVDGSTYGHASSAVIAAGPNPTNPRFEVVAFAGLGAEATWHCVERLPRGTQAAGNVVVLAVGSSPRALVVKDRTIQFQIGAEY